MNGTNGAQPTNEALLKEQAAIIVDYQSYLLGQLRRANASEETIGDVTNATVSTLGTLCPGVGQYVMDELKSRMDPGARARAEALEKSVDQVMRVFGR